MTGAPLYGPRQSRFARYLERRELRRPAAQPPVRAADQGRGLRGNRKVPRYCRVQRVLAVGVAEALPAGDGSFDAAVVGWVLCSVAHPAGALRELQRVLAPEGELRFYEHVRSGNVVFHGVQRAVDALFWTRALGGCRTTRDTLAAIRAAGFDVVALERGFHSSSLLTITSAPYVLGTARRGAGV